MKYLSDERMGVLLRTAQQRRETQTRGRESSIIIESDA